MNVGIGYWIGFFVFVVVMLALDLGVFHRKASAPTMKSALGWSAVWISLAFVFAGLVWLQAGKAPALDFVTAYLLEKSLSIDNLFIFILVFGFFKIQIQHQHKLLFWGVFGALIMRVLFIFAGTSLLHHFAWLMFVFGLFLLVTGFRMFFEKEGAQDLNSSPVIKGLRKLLPLRENVTEPKLVVREQGKLYATQFLLALLFIETSDLIFAVDSIPAVLAVSQDTFIVVTSNIFAIMGLRSLYFALSGVLPMFRYIKYALAIILAFIGFKMIFNEGAAMLHWHAHIGNGFSLFVIVGLITISIIASLIVERTQQRRRF